MCPGGGKFPLAVSLVCFFFTPMCFKFQQFLDRKKTPVYGNRLPVVSSRGERLVMVLDSMKCV